MVKSSTAQHPASATIHSQSILFYPFPQPALTPIILKQIPDIFPFHPHYTSLQTRAFSKWSHNNVGTIHRSEQLPNTTYFLLVFVSSVVSEIFPIYLNQDHTRSPMWLGLEFIPRLVWPQTHALSKHQTHIMNGKIYMLYTTVNLSICMYSNLISFRCLFGQLT